MKKNESNMRKHYSTLDIQERVSAIMAAFGRGDTDELNALVDSAPRVTLQAPDCGRRLQRLMWIAGFHRSNVLTGLALFLLSPRAESADDDSSKLSRILAIALARQQAFQDFCAEQGIDSAVLSKHLSGEEVMEIARLVWLSTGREMPSINLQARDAWHEFLQQLLD